MANIPLRDYLIEVYNATPEWLPNQLEWYHQVWFPEAEVYVCASNTSFNELFAYLRDEYDDLPVLMEDIRDCNGIRNTFYHHEFVCLDEKQKEICAMPEYWYINGRHRWCGPTNTRYIANLHDYDRTPFLHEFIKPIPLERLLYLNMGLYDELSTNKWLRARKYRISTQMCREWLLLNPPLAGESRDSYRDRCQLDFGISGFPSTHKLMTSCVYPSWFATAN